MSTKTPEQELISLRKRVAMLAAAMGLAGAIPGKPTSPETLQASLSIPRGWNDLVVMTVQRWAMAAELCQKQAETIVAQDKKIAELEALVAASGAKSKLAASGDAILAAAMKALPTDGEA